MSQNYSDDFTDGDVEVAYDEWQRETDEQFSREYDAYLDKLSNDAAEAYFDEDEYDSPDYDTYVGEDFDEYADFGGEG